MKISIKRKNTNTEKTEKVPFRKTLNLFDISKHLDDTEGRGNHTVVFGSAGCGKTAYIKEEIYAILKRNDPKDKIYILGDSREFEDIFRYLKEQGLYIAEIECQDMKMDMNIFYKEQNTGKYAEWEWDSPLNLRLDKTIFYDCKCVSPLYKTNRLIALIDIIKSVSVNSSKNEKSFVFLDENCFIGEEDIFDCFLYTFIKRARQLRCSIILDVGEPEYISNSNIYRLGIMNNIKYFVSFNLTPSGRKRLKEMGLFESYPCSDYEVVSAEEFEEWRRNVESLVTNSTVGEGVVFFGRNTEYINFKQTENGYYYNELHKRKEI